MVKLTKRDLAIIGGAAGVADFLAEGRLSAPLSRALKKAAVAAGKRAIFTAPAAARVAQATAIRGAGTLAQVGKTIALRHPVLTAGAVVLYTYQNRDELGSLVEQGYEVVQEMADISRTRIREEGLIRPLKKVKRPTKFNKMVSKGMKSLKSSTSYGKKGVVNAPKKAFKAVVSAASAVTKGKKLPKSGLKRKLMSLMRRIR